MLTAAPVLGFLVIPILAGFVLLGPLRHKPQKDALWAYAAMLIGCLLLATLLAATRPEASLRVAASLAALLLGPASGLFVAFRTEGVRADRRLGFILGPLGYLAGCAVAIRILVGLGFGLGK